MSTELTNLISGSGSPPNPSGSTSFGFYDDDSQFVTDAKSVAKWIARKQGYPIMQVELTWNEVYDCFEDAVSEYSSMVNNSNMQDWMLNYMGTNTGSNYTQKFPNNKFTFVHRYTDGVASEVGAGGNIDWKSGSIDLVSGQQNYDIQQLWGAVSESNKRIDIKEVYHFRPGDAIGSSYALDSNWFFGNNSLINQMGGSYPASSRTMYYVYPAFEDVLRANELELSDKIRKSSYSYEIINNKIKLFPTPDTNTTLWFRYTVNNNDPLTDDDSSSYEMTDGVSDISNVPYENISYNTINSMGQNWIKKYTLALAKELLGTIRRKYDTLPIPNDNINLDGDTLISDARDIKQELKEELSNLLEKTSQENMVERENNMQQNVKEQMGQFPLLPTIK